MHDKHQITDSLSKKTEFYGLPIPGYPELPMEEAVELKISTKRDPVPLVLLLRSNLVQQELSRMNINSLSLLDKTVQV